MGAGATFRDDRFKTIASMDIARIENFQSVSIRFPHIQTNKSGGMDGFAKQANRTGQNVFDGLSRNSSTRDSSHYDSADAISSFGVTDIELRRCGRQFQIPWLGFAALRSETLLLGRSKNLWTRKSISEGF
jgi:hypothetical protein